MHDLLSDALPETTFASETSCWFRPFGLPLVIITDQDPRFLGSCLQKEEELGIEVKFVPEAAYYEMGLIERHNHTWWSMLEKTIDALQTMDVDKLQIAAVACDDSFNSFYQRCGRSPQQALFARMKRLPSMMLTDRATFANVTFPNWLQNEQLTFTEYARCEAIKAFAEDEIDKSVKAASQSAVRDPCKYDNYPGEQVAFLKRHSKQGQRRKPGEKSTTRPARLIGHFLCKQDPSQGRNLWITHGGRIYSCGPLQIEPAVGYENMVLSPEMLDDLQKFVKQRDPVVPDQNVSTEVPAQETSNEGATVVLDPFTGAIPGPASSFSPSPAVVPPATLPSSETTALP